VEETFEMQVLDPEAVISTGNVTMIFELAIRALIVVNAKVRFVVTPIEEFKAVTTPPEITEGLNV
jgi:hypothetical protein